MRITLNNHGADSFKRKVYGKNITIARMIYQSGKSSYKIFNDKSNFINQFKVHQGCEQFNYVNTLFMSLIFLKNVLLKFKNYTACNLPKWNEFIIV